MRRLVHLLRRAAGGVVRVSDPFAGLLGDLGFSEFFGSGPIPPESVARKILGVPLAVPLHRDGIKAAFRFQVKVLRPDLPTDAAADALRREHAKGTMAAELEALLWARDDLLHRLPKPVTGLRVPWGGSGSRHAPPPPCEQCVTADKASTGPGSSRISGCRCKGCHGARRTRAGEPYTKDRGHRWHSYCWPCASDQENARQRDLRRQARANRRCATCTRTFTPPRSDGLYCSGACRQRAYRQRVGVVA
jgi:hypothetical protein